MPRRDNSAPDQVIAKVVERLVLEGIKPSSPKVRRILTEMGYSADSNRCLRAIEAYESRQGVFTVHTADSARPESFRPAAPTTEPPPVTAIPTPAESDDADDDDPADDDDAAADAGGHGNGSGSMVANPNAVIAMVNDVYQGRIEAQDASKRELLAAKDEIIEVKEEVISDLRRQRTLAWSLAAVAALVAIGLALVLAVVWARGSGHQAPVDAERREGGAPAAPAAPAPAATPAIVIAPSSEPRPDRPAPAATVGASAAATSASAAAIR